MLDETLRDKNMIIIETFNEKAYIFDVIERDGEYYLKFNNIPQLIKRLIVKPNFWIIFEDDSYLEFKDILKAKKQEISLIKNYYIDPAIFQKLVKSGIISYTFGVAELYDLPRMQSRDYEYHKNDYKHTKNKEKVLGKLKNGIFN